MQIEGLKSKSLTRRALTDCKLVEQGTVISKTHCNLISVCLFVLGGINWLAVVKNILGTYLKINGSWKVNV